MYTLHHTPAGQGEHLLVVTDVVTLKATGQETSGRQLVLEVRTPPGGGPPMLHRHEPLETFYILEGEFEISTVDTDGTDHTVRLAAGDTVTIPSLAWHIYRNVGATLGRFVAVISPAGMEAFFREIGRPIADPTAPPQPAGPPTEAQREQMLAIIQKHMEVLLPVAQ